MNYNRTVGSESPSRQGKYPGPNDVIHCWGQRGRRYLCGWSYEAVVLPTYYRMTSVTAVCFAVTSQRREALGFKGDTFRNSYR